MFTDLADMNYPHIPDLKWWDMMRQLTPASHPDGDCISEVQQELRSRFKALFLSQAMSSLIDLPRYVLDLCWRCWRNQSQNTQGSLNVPIFHITQPLGIWSIMATNPWHCDFLLKQKMPGWFCQTPGLQQQDKPGAESCWDGNDLSMMPPWMYQLVQDFLHPQYEYHHQRDWAIHPESSDSLALAYPLVM